MAFVRTVKTASGATAVQLVHGKRRGGRRLEHVGPAHDERDLEALKTAAAQRLASLYPTLDLGLDLGLGLGRAIHGLPPGRERRGSTAFALRIDRARHPGQQVEYVGKAIAERIEVGTVTSEVLEHALSEAECLSGSWEAHSVIVQT